jgi:mitochondrial fission 1 protein
MSEKEVFLLQEQLKEDVLFSTEEIKELEKQMNPEKSLDQRFALASAYIKSKNEFYIQKGIEHFLIILKKDSDSQVEKDCLYLISLGYYHLDDFVESRKWINHLLQKYPEHRQATIFNKLLESKVTNDGVLGLLAVGGVATAAITVAALGVGIGLLMLKKK